MNRSFIKSALLLALLATTATAYPADAPAPVTAAPAPAATAEPTTDAAAPVAAPDTRALDDKQVAKYLYTPREAEALLKGGVQRLYLGNLRVGGHELVALFTGKGPNGQDYSRGAQLKFEKSVGAKYLELKISDKQRKAQPEFAIKDWE